MSINPVLYSSRSEEWPTPKVFFEQLNSEFHFSLDPCATAAKAKCKRYFTKRDDGLAQDWGHHVVFCNPPYGRDIIRWTEKCYQAPLSGATVVLLVHARTDTRWFHDFVLGKAELRFVRGRLRFADGKQSAPFPSLVAIYRPRPAHKNRMERGATAIERLVIAHPSAPAFQAAAGADAGASTARRLAIGLRPLMRPVATMERRSA